MYKMHFSWSLTLSVLVGLVAAQTSTSAARSSSTTAAGAMVNTHIIQVGSTNGSSGFFPNNLQAPVGDYVQFQFHAQNRSVVQASFDSPCAPIENNPNAFFSGYMPAQSEILTFTIRIPDFDPIYFYSPNGKECQDGMVGAINAPESGMGSLQSFSQAAAQAKANITPGQPSISNPKSSPPTASNGSNAPVSSTDSSAIGIAQPSPTSNMAADLGSQPFFGLGVALAAALAFL